jgi:AcrR family transcriptional regulator
VPPRSSSARSSSPGSSPPRPVVAGGFQGDTKTRLMDAVVRIFADKGFHATSMRAVTQLAGTSVSAANYHFGSKEELLRAALIRRAKPLNALRLKALESAEAQTRPGAPRVKAIIEAFVLPLFELRSDQSSSTDSGRALAARLYVDPPDRVKKMQQEIFGAVTSRFRDALARAVPGGDQETIDLAFELSFGVVVHLISGRFVWPDQRTDPSGMKKQQVVESLVAFATAGLVALLPDEQADPKSVGGQE